MRQSEKDDSFEFSSLILSLRCYLETSGEEYFTSLCDFRAAALTQNEGKFVRFANCRHI